MFAIRFQKDNNLSYVRTYIPNEGLEMSSCIMHLVIHCAVFLEVCVLNHSYHMVCVCVSVGVCVYINVQ